MMLARSKSDTNYFFIYLRPKQTEKAETMWQQTQYCELYDYLKEIALTEEGAFGGLQGDKATLENTEKWFQDRNIRSIEALMSIHCEDEDDEQPSPLGLFNWFKRFSAETFAAPFMDVTFQNAPMQVKHLYHGQHTVDGAEITPHSPYWTTDLGLALGHALSEPSKKSQEPSY